MEKITLLKIRACLQANIGSKVKLTVKKSRNKVLVWEGILESTYPSVFTVRLDGNNLSSYQKRVSHSYSDLLTKSVEITIFNITKNVQNSKMIV